MNDGCQHLSSKDARKLIIDKLHNCDNKVYLEFEKGFSESKTVEDAEKNARKTFDKFVLFLKYELPYDIVCDTCLKKSFFELIMKYFIYGSTYFSKLDNSEDYISAIIALCDEDIGVLNTIIKKIKEKYETYLSLHNMETMDNNILTAISKSYDGLEGDKDALSHSINILNMVFDLVFPLILKEWLFTNDWNHDVVHDMVSDFLTDAYKRSIAIVNSTIKKVKDNEKRNS
jgi:hypothetical protein